MTNRLARQNLIRDIVRHESVRTQRDLVQHLKERGYTYTQATISRDIAEMGLHKTADGFYVLQEDLHLQRMIRDMVLHIARANNLVVVKAKSGTASGVAAALDSTELPDIIGTVAGDDTILIIAATDEAAQSFESMLKRLYGQEHLYGQD